MVPPVYIINTRDSSEARQRSIRGRGLLALRWLTQSRKRCRRHDALGWAVKAFCRDTFAE
jgi:hypothetical protein